MFRTTGFAKLLLVFLISNASWAQEITATPGTYELLEGATMQFNGKVQQGAPQPERYQWEIFSGDGAQLVGANQARVTFIAPVINESSRNFTLQLNLHYADGKSSAAQINVRVHKKTSKVRARRTGPWLSGAIGFGFGYLWGDWWPWPPIVVIPCPWPDIIWYPDDYDPIVMPYDNDPQYNDWLSENPDYADLYAEDGLLAEEFYDDYQSDMDNFTYEPFIESEAYEAEAMMESEAFDTPEPMIEPEPMDNGGYDYGGYDDYDQGGWDSGGDWGGGGWDDGGDWGGD